MTVMEAARVLGAAIQEDTRYAAYQDAQAIVERSKRSATTSRLCRISSMPKPSRSSPTRPF